MYETQRRRYLPMPDYEVAGDAVMMTVYGGVTAEHFQHEYGKKVRAFVYHSKRLHELESFSSDAGINVMVINVQALAATGAELPPENRTLT